MVYKANRLHKQLNSRVLRIITNPVWNEHGDDGSGINARSPGRPESLQGQGER
jgi:hypothetical protein